jgi:hypothetical protein
MDPNALTAAIMSSDLYTSSSPQRVAFVVDTEAHAYASGAPATIAIRPPHGTLGAFSDTELHQAGLPNKRGVYVFEPVLASAGVYDAVVQTNGHRIDLPFEVKAKPAAPIAGQRAPTAPSPTPAQPLGVNPLCTRVPACPLHNRSLSSLIGKGRPVAVLFATPALCQSQYCGPVLDTLLSVMGPYQSQVDFVHVEIYRDRTGADVSPTVDAWHLQSEPWLFGVDRHGVVRGRLDGAFGADEMRALLDPIRR